MAFEVFVVVCRLSSCSTGLRCFLSYGILVPGPGIEPTLPCIGGWLLNQWTIRKSRVYILMIVSHSWNRWAIHYRFFLVYLFAPLLVLKKFTSVSILSWLLGIHHWLILHCQNWGSSQDRKTEDSLCCSSSHPSPVLFFLPPPLTVLSCSSLDWFSLVHIASVLKILSTTSWEFPPFCVHSLLLEYENIFLLSWFFSYFWWSSSSSNFLRESTWKHFFFGLTCLKMSFFCPPTLLITWILYWK